MNIYTVAAVGIIGCIICVLLRQYRPELAALAGIAVSLFVLTGIINMLFDTIAFFRELAENAEMSALSIRTILKCIGICFVASFAADTCRDSGESGLAARIELYGRVAAIAVSIPLFREFITLVLSLTKM